MASHSRRKSEKLVTKNQKLLAKKLARQQKTRQLCSVVANSVRMMVQVNHQTSNI